VGEAASDGAAIADGRVPDPGQHLREQRNGGCDQLASLGRPLPRHGPDRDAARALGDVRERIDTVQIDESTRCGQPHIQNRHQALPAGEDAGIVAVGRELGDGFLHRGYRHVFEGRRLHISSTKSTSA
jgi:hypothetical protein